MNIRLRDIQVHLPQGAATRELFRLASFDVESGHKVLIQGESGKGKTTLLHLIAGLFLPFAGQVRLGEHLLNEWSDEQRCHFRRTHIALIFQKLNLLEHLTVFENVQLALGLGAADDQARVAQALKAVGLGDRADARSSVLSLGEQQRVAVARALASDAEIILADEPTSSLDEKNAANVIDLLLSAAQHKTLIVVSHDHRIEKKFNKIVRFEQLVQR